MTLDRPAATGDSMGMSLATAELPDDPDALRAFAIACQAELKVAELSVQLRTLEIEKLKFQIAKLRRMKFGRSSEKINRKIDQLELRLEELESGAAEDEAKDEIKSGTGSKGTSATGTRKKPKREPLPAHLSRKDVVHQPADGADCTCPDCGGAMSKLGEDVTEVLDYVPGHFRVIRHVRPKFACQACDAITQAQAPAMPTPRGRATPALLSHLLVSKYLDHLPLYRQSTIFARDGVDLSRSTLADWVGQVAWLLDPLVDAIGKHVLAGEKIHGDDTTVRVLEPGLGRTKIGRLWVYVRDDRPHEGTAPPAAIYFYSPDRGSEHPAAHLANFTGYLQADGYAGFEALYDPARQKPGPIIEVACWAHCRRKIFDDWEQTKSPIAKEALDRIAAIYHIEEKARFAPAAERVEHRKESARLIEALFAWITATLERLSVKFDLAKAFNYILRRRVELTRFLTDGRLEADNNIAENAMRTIAVGRRNYLFVGSDNGGRRAAAMYTILASAKLNGLNPESYLKDVLTRVAEGHPINRIDELLPWRILAPPTPPSG